MKAWRSRRRWAHLYVGRTEARRLSDLRCTLRPVTIQQIVKAEVARYPRGERGSAQRMFRGAYAALRLNALGRQPQIAPTPEAAQALALRLTREAAPEWAAFLPAITGE